MEKKLNKRAEKIRMADDEKVKYEKPIEFKYDDLQETKPTNIELVTGKTNTTINKLFAVHDNYIIVLNVIGSNMVEGIRHIKTTLNGVQSEFLTAKIAAHENFYKNLELNEDYKHESLLIFTQYEQAKGFLQQICRS